MYLPVSRLLGITGFAFTFDSEVIRFVYKMILSLQIDSLAVHFLHHVTKRSHKLGKNRELIKEQPAI